MLFRSKIDIYMGALYIYIYNEIKACSAKSFTSFGFFFEGIGCISKVAGNMYIYEVSSFIHFHKLINHFDRYPLETTKLIHYNL